MTDREVFDLWWNSKPWPPGASAWDAWQAALASERAKPTIKTQLQQAQESYERAKKSSPSLNDLLTRLGGPDAPEVSGEQQAEPGQTTKEAWWAGYRVGKGLPADTPRQEALAAPPADDEAARLLRKARRKWVEDGSITADEIDAYLAKVGDNAPATGAGTASG